LRENDRHSFISKSLTFSSEKRILSDKHRDTHLKRYLSSPSFRGATEFKKNEKNKTNKPNDGKHSYSPYDIHKNDVSRSFINSSHRIYNSSKFSDKKNFLIF